MPLYKWSCECGFKTRSLLSARPLGNPVCSKCNKLMEPDVGGSTSVMESLDNGIMPRKVERLRDIVDLVKDHAQSDKDKNSGLV